jgi:hypothetical protein
MEHHAINEQRGGSSVDFVNQGPSISSTNSAATTVATSGVTAGNFPSVHDNEPFFLGQTTILDWKVDTIDGYDQGFQKLSLFHLVPNDQISVSPTSYKPSVNFSAPNGLDTMVFTLISRCFSASEKE